MNEYLNCSNCFNYNNSEQPFIEVREFSEKQQENVVLNCNVVVFIFKGKICYQLGDEPELIATKGQFVFIPIGNRLHFSTLKKSIEIVFRLHGHLRLCESFAIERLFSIERNESKKSAPDTSKNLIFLKGNPRIMYFLKGLVDSIEGGLKCRFFFEGIIKEFFIIMRTYYTKESLRDFFHLILSTDTAFSEYVLLNHYKYKTVNELAASMNYSSKMFSKKFKDVFGKTAYHWMKEQKMIALHNAICSDKLFKLIVTDYGFSSQQHLTNFCRANFGQTPGEIRKNGTIE
jgi:AraC-like DNA-binding protein